MWELTECTPAGTPTMQHNTKLHKTIHNTTQRNTTRPRPTQPNLTHNTAHSNTLDKSTLHCITSHKITRSMALHEAAYSYVLYDYAYDCMCANVCICVHLAAPLCICDLRIVMYIFCQGFSKDSSHHNVQRLHSIFRHINANCLTCLQRLKAQTGHDSLNLRIHHTLEKLDSSTPLLTLLTSTDGRVKSDEVRCNYSTAHATLEAWLGAEACSM